jgi:amino acid transporter
MRCGEPLPAHGKVTVRYGLVSVLCRRDLGELHRQTALWFILAIMILAYAVRSVYIESCSMFVRGGVYRVVKEAMGSTIAKFSVSALMFDYILAGPISGVSAGLYLTELINQLLGAGHARFLLPMNATAALFAVLVTIYFWCENIKGLHESSEIALRIMYVTTVMVVILIGWCAYTLAVRGGHLPPLPRLSTITYSKGRARLVAYSR